MDRNTYPLDVQPGCPNIVKSLNNLHHLLTCSEAAHTPPPLQGWGTTTPSSGVTNISQVTEKPKSPQQTSKLFQEGLSHTYIHPIWAGTTLFHTDRPINHTDPQEFKTTIGVISITKSTHSSKGHCLRHYPSLYHPRLAGIALSHTDRPFSHISPQELETTNLVSSTTESGYMCYTKH